jgi:CRISPR-associated protein Cas2
MFVSIALDPGSEERAQELADILAQYGFTRVQRLLWESMTISPDTLNRVKRDMDKATDGFDKLRFFQFPMEGTLVLTSLKEKKWRRMVAKDSGQEKPAAPHKKVAVAKSKVIQRPVKRG